MENGIEDHDPSVIDLMRQNHWLDEVLQDPRFLEMLMLLESNEKEILGMYLATHPQLTDVRIAVLYEGNNNPDLLINYFSSINGYKPGGFSNEDEARDWLKAVPYIYLYAFATTSFYHLQSLLTYKLPSFLLLCRQL